LNKHRSFTRKSDGARSVNKGRHETRCTICAHSQQEEIEQEFVSWASPTSIAKIFSITRDSIYRHAHALGLFDKRRRNIRAALERIIEKADSVEVNANAVVSAVSALARNQQSGPMGGTNRDRKPECFIRPNDRRRT
jgi:hypothetical protein